MSFTIDKPGFYKTRDGRKVEIIAVNGRPPQPIIGYVVDQYIPNCWSVDGKFHQNEDSVADIVSEWREPVKYSLEIWTEDSPQLGNPDTPLIYKIIGPTQWSNNKTKKIKNKVRITVEEVIEND